MKCPKCNHMMVEIKDDLFQALKCTGCSGIWFKDGTHEIARNIKNISAIDNEKNNTLSVYDEVKDISCPDCHQKMTKMIDKSQHHISFEACSYCDGVFFDVGEFKDLSTHTLLERIIQTVETLKINLKHI